jgi:hypothetical protein
MKSLKIFLISLGFILTTILSFPALSQAATYYSSNNGSGSTCTSATPCTYSSGISKLASGDSLVLLPGTYNVSAFSISKSNVTIGGDGSGEVIFYGGYTNYGTRVTYNALVTLSGSNTKLHDITVANSPGEGIEMTGANSQLINVYVHHSGENGIIIKANYGLCDGCRAWSNAMSNQGGTQSVGWGTGISACRHPQHATIRNSVAWDNWGEGLSTFEAEYTTIENSISYNNWSVNMYLSDTTNTIARGNIIYMAGNTMTNGTKAGLAMGDEVSNPSSANNTVVNNFIYGGNHALWIWDNHQQNTVISNNTFVNATGGTTVEMDGGTNNFFRNNIIIQDDSRSISGGTSGFTLSNNIWSKSYSGKGTTDVVGNPQLARTGSVSAGTLTGDWFKLTSASSLAIDKAVADPAVTVDFFQTARPVGSAPDIGGHEYVYTSSSPTSAPTNTPVPTPITVLLGDINGDKNVNILDFTLLSNSFGTSNTSADLNKDGVVNILDFTLLSNNFGKSG